MSKIRNSKSEILNKFKIQNTKSQTLVLVFILILAGFFRLYRLNQVPPSSSLDEVSIGWNAFSLLKTGRDEYGYRWPVLLRAYDDWRPALYVYLVIPFVKVFGLSARSVRLPAVFLSLLTILTAYFLVKRLFPNSKFKTHYSLLTIFFLTISPWHIYISRLGHEVNAGSTFIVLAIFFFLKWLDSNTPVHRARRWWLFLASLFFVLSLYTYQSLKAFTPLMVLSLGLIFKKEVWARKKEVITAFLFGVFLLLPFFRVTFTPEGLMRFKGSSIFSATGEIDQRSAQRIARDYQEADVLGLFFDQPWLARTDLVLRSYFSHFDPSWLFFNQGRERHKVPSLGLFYFWELPFLLIGAYQLAKGNWERRKKLLLLVWFLLGPLPASLATQTPHGMRSFNLLPVPQILIGLGLWATVRYLKKRGHLRWGIIKGGGITVVIFSLLFLYHHYFVNFPYEQSDSFQYPLRKAIEYVLTIKNRYQKIVFSNQNHCHQSYMFFLFFSQYDPQVYLRQGGTLSGGFAEGHFFGKYEFRPIDWQSEEEKGVVLYIGNLNDFPQGVAPLKTFSLLSGEEVIKVVEKSF